MSKLRYSQVDILNGEVISTEYSDTFERSSLDELVTNIQRNARLSYKDVLDTETGAIRVSANGMITVWTVQIVLD